MIQNNNIGKSNRVVTGVVRGSYVRLMTAQQSLNGNLEYSVCALIPKTDKKTVADIQAAIESAKAKGKNEKWGGKIPPNLKTPLRDGDIERPDDPAYKGHYFLNAKSKNKPQVVDSNVQPILDPQEVYSGAYFKFSFSFYPFAVNGNNGVACGLENAQKVRDGDPLGGGASAQSDFDPVSSDDDLESALA